MYEQLTTYTHYWIHWLRGSNVVRNTDRPTLITMASKMAQTPNQYDNSSSIQLNNYVH